MLYYIGDSDRPLYVIATSMEAAVKKWRAVIARENELKVSEVEGPDEARFVCNDCEIVLPDGSLVKPMDK